MVFVLILAVGIFTGAISEYLLRGHDTDWKVLPNEDWHGSILLLQSWSPLQRSSEMGEHLPQTLKMSTPAQPNLSCLPIPHQAVR